MQARNHKAGILTCLTDAFIIGKRISHPGQIAEFKNAKKAIRLYSYVLQRETTTIA